MHAEVCRDAIAEFVPNAIRVGFVRKHINEAGGDDQVAGINCCLTVDRISGDEGDSAPDESYVGD